MATMCLVSQSTVTLDGDKLVHVQKWDGKETKFVREIKDGKLVMVRLNKKVYLIYDVAKSRSIKCSIVEYVLFNKVQILFLSSGFKKMLCFLQCT